MRNYNAIETVFVTIDFRKDNEDPYTVSEDSHQMESQFLEWLHKNRMWPEVMHSTGAGVTRASFRLTEWPKVEAWLLQHDVRPKGY